MLFQNERQLVDKDFPDVECTDDLISGTCSGDQDRYLGSIFEAYKFRVSCFNQYHFIVNDYFFFSSYIKLKTIFKNIKELATMLKLPETSILKEEILQTQVCGLRQQQVKVENRERGTSVAPLCSSWDTGRVAPFVGFLIIMFQIDEIFELVFLTDKKFVCPHCWNIFFNLS